MENNKVLLVDLDTQQRRLLSNNTAIHHEIQVLDKVIQEVWTDRTGMDSEVLPIFLNNAYTESKFQKHFEEI